MNNSADRGGYPLMPWPPVLRWDDREAGEAEPGSSPVLASPVSRARCWLAGHDAITRQLASRLLRAMMPPATVIGCGEDPLRGAIGSGADARLAVREDDDLDRVLDRGI